MISSLEAQRAQHGNTSSIKSRNACNGETGIPRTSSSVAFETDQGFTLSQSSYVSEIPEVPINSSRRKEQNQETTSWEKTKLRAVLGGISWHAQQVAPHLSAKVGILLSEVNTSTVATLQRANQLLQQAKHRKDHEMHIHAFPRNTPMVMVAWVDAAGVVLGAAPATLMQGEITGVSLMSWRSNKIDRVCRSPGAAEVQAAVNGEEVLYYLRYQWSEVRHGLGDPRTLTPWLQRLQVAW